MFPSSLFSTGGDEINANCYTQDVQTQQELSAAGKTFEQALDTFTQAAHKAIEAQGKTPVVWEGKKTCGPTIDFDFTPSFRRRNGARSQRYTLEFNDCFVGFLFPSIRVLC